MAPQVSRNDLPALGTPILTKKEGGKKASRRPRGHQFEDLNTPPLADPVNPIGDLILLGRVPPAIIMNDHRRGHQVNAGPSCFEAPHVNSAVGVLIKTGDDLPAIPPGPSNSLRISPSYLFA